MDFVDIPRVRKRTLEVDSVSGSSSSKRVRTATEGPDAAVAAAAANNSASRQQQAAAMLQLLDGVLIDAGVDDKFGELFNFGESQRQ
eukprot:7067-Heterococcus_DN1.PRE.4